MYAIYNEDCLEGMKKIADRRGLLRDSGQENNGSGCET